MDVRLPDGTVIQNVPDGTTKADLVAKLQKNGMSVPSEWLAQDKPAETGNAISKAIGDIPRQLGLTARYGLEGLGGAAEIVSEPIRYITDRLTGNVGKTQSASKLASRLADTIGLPTPQTSDERVVGDASRLVAGTVGMGGGMSQIGKVASPKVATALTTMAANPLQQGASAAGAGLFGGSARENGGNTAQQVIASLIGGIGGGLSASSLQSLAPAAKSLLTRSLTPQELDVKIGGLLRQAGVDYGDLSAGVQQSLRSELASALKAGKEVDPVALSRLAAFKSAGVTPTQGMISQNPVQITREQNLAKIGANTGDDGLYGLAQVQNSNNAKLISNLNALGADRGDLQRAGETVASAILGRQAAMRSAEQSAWDIAKGSEGYKQPISSKVLSDINGTLDSEGLMPFMNPTISRYMEAFQQGHPFTPQAYRNLQSMLAREVTKGGNEGAAAGLARRVLEQSDLQPVGFANAENSLVPQALARGMQSADGAAAEAIDAVNQARRATRAAYAYEDSSPIVRSVLSDSATSDPARIAQRYIIGGTANEAQDLVREVGARPEIKNAVLDYLKKQALSGASDETGKFSQSAFNRALNSIGDRKLNLLFTKDEVQALKTNGRVAALMQSQPVGSAVNNSNSGGLMLGRGYDMLKTIAGKVPFGQSVVIDPLKNIELSVRTKQAQKILPGLLAPTEKRAGAGSLLIPAAVAGSGLLSAP